jgi:4-hydroxy-tetrahydrodipicolinate synthase
MTNKQLIGTGVAIITPFKDGKEDYDSLHSIIDHVIEGGVEYIVSLGTTGESVTLDYEEQKRVLDFTLEKTDGRVPIVAGFGGNNTKQLIEHIQSFDLTGVHSILSSSPAYNKPPQNGIIAHYTALADASPKPIILYNVPGRTSSNLTAETTLALAEHPNISGIKEASGDLEQATDIIRQAPDDFLVVSGDDPTALALISIGGKGVISVIANALPGPFSNMIRYALEGDFVKAREINNRLFPIHKWLYLEGNPVGVKAAVEALGLASREVRLPLLPMSDKNAQVLKDLIQKVGK